MQSEDHLADGGTTAVLGGQGRTALLLICVLGLAGCWDMTAEAWAHAEELCKPFGGVYATDADRVNGGLLVTAQCIDKTRAVKVFPRQ